jgi:hypothetical protein
MRTAAFHREAQVMGESGEFGMRAGGIAPAHSPGGAEWAMIGVANDMEPAEFAKFFAAKSPILSQYEALAGGVSPFFLCRHDRGAVDVAPD